MTATKAATTTRSAPAVATHDHAASTPWTSLYHVPSATHAHVTYTVRYDVREGRWSCECPAKCHPWCRHREAAATLRETRWWARVMADYTAAMLVDMIRGKDDHIRTGMADRDDLACRAAAVALLAARGGAGAA